MIRRLALLLLLAAAPAHAQPALRLEITGPATPALLEAPACTPPDNADAPARAIRLADGTVQLYSTDQINRASRGPDLAHLRHDCTVLYRGAGHDDPADFDDRSWITSLWTEDGQHIWAILHNEFHGQLRPALCPSRRYMDCWYNALTLALSADGGRSFTRAPHALIAALPYRFDQLEPGHHGYFNPTGMVRGGDGALYLMASTTRAGAQAPGNCLLRTGDPSDPAAWRAWNGQAFAASFIDPYQEHAPPAEHVCAPVGQGALRFPVTGLVRHAPTGQYIAVMQDAGPNGAIYYATSADLLQWSQPASLMPATGLRSWSCHPPDPLAYPSLIDPDSPDRNFAVVGGTAWLYLTRFDETDCKTFRDRTLIRFSVRISS